MEIAKIGSSAPPPPIALFSGTGAPSVATELPAAQTVSSISNDGAGVRSDGGGRTDSWSERRVVIDPGTQEIVTQTIDALTQDVVVQTPDRARLGMRAYIDDVTRRQEETARFESGESHRLPALMI